MPDLRGRGPLVCKGLWSVPEKAFQKGQLTWMNKELITSEASRLFKGKLPGEGHGMHKDVK